MLHWDKKINILSIKQRKGSKKVLLKVWKLTEEKKQEHSRKPYKNLSEIEKQRLVEYRKGYYGMPKVSFECYQKASKNGLLFH